MIGGAFVDNKILDGINLLYQRGITSREELLVEFLRVKMTQKFVKKNTSVDVLFSKMKEVTESELGIYNADRMDFQNVFAAFADAGAIDFVTHIYKEDRGGSVVSPKCLTDYIKARIQKLSPNHVLITEAEKHLLGLKELVDVCVGKVTLTSQNRMFYLLLQMIFEDQTNVSVRHISIYTELLVEDRYDYIFCLPVFGYKINDVADIFFTRDSDGIALQNLIQYLSEDGSIDYISPAKLLFSGMGFDKLRKLVEESCWLEELVILPDGLFRPWTAIKTYLISISKTKKDTILIGSLEIKKDCFQFEEKREISSIEFNNHEDWRIELLLSDENECLQQFKTSEIPKKKLKDLAEIFRGKSILKKDAMVGDIAVLNISNIEDGEINYDDLETIREEKRKIKRYELFQGDVVLSCRGTAMKTAVFDKQEQIVIASSNIIVIRPGKEILGEYIKIFFDTPVGNMMIKSFQRGSTVMNINHTDIMEMEVPLLPLEKQEEMVSTYKKELKKYKQTMLEAAKKLEQTKNQIYKVIQGGSI